MSSAILYLAIIAIWALVLIPRWLRRDSAHGMAPAAYPEAAGDNPPDTLTDEAGPDGDAAGDDVAVAGDADTVRRPAPAPVSTAESRRRMLAGRRRLLGMLTILEAAAIALAVLRLAAIWVLIPPTLMLAGYLLLLREAAHADAERAAHEAAAEAARARAGARARARARERAAAQPAQRVTPAEGSPVASPAAVAAELAARFAAAPVPADYEDSGPGRDFAPGLAGKYTTSYAHADPGEGYEEPRLRAVGD